MRKWMLLLVCVVLLAGQNTSTAQVTVLGANRAAELPSVVLSGLEAYKAKGPEEAVMSWVKNGPLDGDKDALSQANVLRQVQTFYGSYESFDVISSRDLTQRVRIVYLVMNYEKGPLFGKFVCYRSDREWMVTNFVLNTKETAVLPADVTLAN
jgi:hypothetical protein